jgi:dimethylhistidine N-methyltransferase
MKREAARERSAEANRIRFYDFHPKAADFFGEVILGLSQRPRAIAPKFFYDERGSQLFEAICQTSEYYPTRTEIAILTRHIEEITSYLRPNCLLVEPGSGNSQKVRILFDANRPRAYIPVDISRDFLLWAARRVGADYPALDVYAICADYTAPFTLPANLPDAHKVVFFPGSSIGNFTPDEAVAFLANLARLVGSGGGVLIGVDIKKDTALLNAAYNDAQGLTADFNLNLLTRINRKLGADFNETRFRHHAFYDAATGRVEMRIVSNDTQVVCIAGRQFEFRENDAITTEYSYKYTIAEFQALSARAGFSSIKAWTDTDGLFSVHYLEAT